MSHERDLPFVGQHRELIVDVAEMLLERDRSSLVDDGILFDANGVLAYDPNDGGHGGGRRWAGRHVE